METAPSALRAGFRTKVFLGAFAAAALSLLALAGLMAWQVRERQRASIERHLSDEAYLIADLLSKATPLDGPGSRSRGRSTGRTPRRPRDVSRRRRPRGGRFHAERPSSGAREPSVAAGGGRRAEHGYGSSHATAAPSAPTCCTSRSALASRRPMCASRCRSPTWMRSCLFRGRRWRAGGGDSACPVRVVDRLPVARTTRQRHRARGGALFRRRSHAPSLRPRQRRARDRGPCTLVGPAARRPHRRALARSRAHGSDSQRHGRRRTCRDRQGRCSSSIAPLSRCCASSLQRPDDRI